MVTLRRVQLLAIAGLGLTTATACTASTGTIGETDEDDEAGRVGAEYVAPVSSASCSSEDAEARGARLAIARVRAMVGLPALDCDDSIRQAAEAHCGYVDANGHVLTHVEVPGRPRFFGVSVSDRLVAKGYRGEPGAEVMSNVVGPKAVDDARGWMNSVYHRAPFLRAENVRFGYGHGDACAIVDFGRAATSERRAQPPVLWPPVGATRVPTEFWSSKESPNPVAGSTVVGSPVTLITTETPKTIFGVLEGPRGVVPTLLLTAKNDAAGLVRAGEAHLVPRAPLSPNTTYTATFTLIGPSASERRELSTTFTTGDK